eukprot:PhM_4_TR8043/c0_g1_i1/m.106619
MNKKTTTTPGNTTQSEAEGKSEADAVAAALGFHPSDELAKPNEGSSAGGGSGGVSEEHPIEASTIPLIRNPAADDAAASTTPWTCAVCHTENSGDRFQCFRCEVQKTWTTVLTTSTNSVGGHDETHRNTSPSSDGGLRWLCRCGAVNKGVVFCAKCNASIENAALRNIQPTAPLKHMDWVCSRCDELNYAHRDQCRKCTAPKADARAMVVDGMVDVHPAPTPSSTSSAARGSNDWTCSCGYRNFASRSSCGVCGQARAGSSPSDAAESTAAPRPKLLREGDWSCQKCASVNFSFRTVCFSCAAPKPREGADGQEDLKSGLAEDGPWICICGTSNEASTKACVGCASERTPVFDASQSTQTQDQKGMWACECGAANMAFRSECFSCGKSAPSDAVAQARTETMRAVEESEQSKVTTTSSAAESNWNCSHCGFCNFPFRGECFACTKPRDVSPTTGSVPMESMFGNFDKSPVTQPYSPVSTMPWECAACATPNEGTQSECATCGLVRPVTEKRADPVVAERRTGPPAGGSHKASDWACSTCGFTNFSRRTECKSCRAPKTDACGAMDQSSSPWSCLCGTANNASQQRCTMCGLDRSLASASSAAPKGDIFNKKKQSRPGDWMCSCGVVNFASRTECFRCRLPRSAAPAESSSLPPMSGAQSSDWVCTCGVVNFASRTKCFRCALPKPGETSSPSAGTPKPPIGRVRHGDWICTACSAVNFASRMSCYKCLAPKAEDAKDAPVGDTLAVSERKRGGALASNPPLGATTRPGDWTCSCGTLNFASRAVCFRCHASKSTNVDTQGSAGGSGGDAAAAAATGAFSMTGSAFATEDVLKELYGESPASGSSSSSDLFGGTDMKQLFGNSSETPTPPRNDDDTSGPTSSLLAEFGGSFDDTLR